MNTKLIAVAAVAALVCTIVATSGRYSKPVAIAVLTLIAAFCGFGFMASFEPGDNAVLFRILYGVFGIGSLLFIVFLILQKPDSDL